MEFIGAPATDLKSLITSSFESWAAASGASGASCALSGGATALIFLSALRNANVDWRKITLFWADERAVPPDDPESNYGLAERMLLSPLGARAPRAIRMPADASHLGQLALWYDDALASELDGGVLDLAILGVGEDGHIASLFPGHPALLQNDLRAVAIEDAPKPPRRRLSLTMRYLLQTKKIWVIAIGPRKLPVLQAAINKSSNATPLDLLMRQAKDVTIFTDQTIRR
ncbi:MAG: 6-phosphogluconolactonase [Cyanobacteria bacterium]|nr:6-phosphogluconolactonase [Cyanobacteriota bacterium]